MPPLPIEEYQAGWVCALPKELTATGTILDEEHEQYKSQMRTIIIAMCLDGSMITTWSLRAYLRAYMVRFRRPPWPTTY
jgi:hypothetical protein